MIPVLYRGSVKNVRGPIRVGPNDCVVFEYSDAYSVFDWGRMPDSLPHKGEALALIAADWFEKLEKGDTWREFSKTAEALALRKANRFGAAFNELGEELQSKGLRTHYAGLVDDAQKEGVGIMPKRLGEIRGPMNNLLVRQVSVIKPSFTSVLGRSTPDYIVTNRSPLPRLIPLEVVFRFSLPPGSSLIERASRDPGYLASIGFGGGFGGSGGFADYKAAPGEKWEFPVLELFTKLEPTDRPVALTEALAISGIPAGLLEKTLFKTAWVAALLKWICGKTGLELADGKLEWGLSETGDSFLVDAIGPDELRILKGEIQLSKEFLRTHYRATPWYEAIVKAKAQAKSSGISDWKRLVSEGPPSLPPAQIELASQLYMTLANDLTGRTWFSESWGLGRVLSELQA